MRNLLAIGAGVEGGFDDIIAALLNALSLSLSLRFAASAVSTPPLSPTHRSGRNASDCARRLFTVVAVNGANFSHAAAPAASV